MLILYMASSLIPWLCNADIILLMSNWVTSDTSLKSENKTIVLIVLSLQKEIKAKIYIVFLI